VAVRRVGESGRLLRIAFQLADDLLGVCGDPGLTGKSTTGDLRAGKQTPLLAHARSTAEWQQLGDYIGRDLTAAELTDARRLLTAAGSRRFVEELAESHLAGAGTILSQLGLAPDLLTMVTALLPALAGTKQVAA